MDIPEHVLDAQADADVRDEILEEHLATESLVEARGAEVARGLLLSTIPRGWRAMTVEEARGLAWNGSVELWDGHARWFGDVRGHTDEYVNVTLRTSSHIVSLAVGEDATLPTSDDLTFVAVRTFDDETAAEDLRNALVALDAAQRRVQSALNKLAERR